MKTVEEWIKEHEECQQELILMRRYLHQHAEVGSDLIQTKAYVVEKLTSWGYVPHCNKHGSIFVVVGNKKGKVLLLRADMDALKMQEESDVTFKCRNGAMHACGHDLHTAMMLETARLLKEVESELTGTVKIVFQPHEEGLRGCKEMIEDGILTHPHVDAAIAVHVILQSTNVTGTISTKKHEICAASTIFEINIKGKCAHGSMPEQGIDAVRIAVKIYQELQDLIPREISMQHANVLTIGILQGGIAHNIIPEQAYLKCSLRSFHKADQIFIMKRIQEIVNHVAQMYGGSVTLHVLQEAPCVYNNPIFHEEIITKLQPYFNENIKIMDAPLSVSEDFAHISNVVPSLFAILACGRKCDGYEHGQHHPLATFDEACMMYGTYFLFISSLQWLKDNRL